MRTRKNTFGPPALAWRDYRLSQRTWPHIQTPIDLTSETLHHWRQIENLGFLPTFSSSPMWSTRRQFQFNFQNTLLALEKLSVNVLLQFIATGPAFIRTSIGTFACLPLELQCWRIELGLWDAYNSDRPVAVITQIKISSVGLRL